MFQTKEMITEEKLDRYIEEAAKAAGYDGGFGVRECDLSNTIWWAAYARQSLEEQTQNNRLPDYLRTCAQEAKTLGVTVPREYILYDAVTGEHLERPNMLRLRKLMLDRRIAGVIFPALDRLSREPIHIGIFEFQAQYVGVRVHYADAPNGSDPMSQMVRMNIASAAKFVKLANRKNARAGNIGRVVKGWVPACKASYGYRYRRDAEIAPDGKIIIKRAWWDIDEGGPDGAPLCGSPAWVVLQIFIWIGQEGRSLYWVANQLNEMESKAPNGGRWTPAKVSSMVHRRCYTGNHAYNANARVPNPNRPLSDITAEVKRTLLRPKSEDERVTFKVPALVTEGLWRKANANIAERGRGRGKQGKAIQALLRNRLFCPKCGKPMVVRRDGRQNCVYYHCSKYFRPWSDKPCDYRKFIPGIWDDLVWQDICAWLQDDTWVEQQLVSQQSQDDNVAKLIRLQQFRISQARSKITKVQEGFEGGIYSVDEARSRISDYHMTIAKAEREIQQLKESLKLSVSSAADIEAMREELRVLRDRNLDEATFGEKLALVSKLGIKVYPSEDLKSMRVICQLDLRDVSSQDESSTTISSETKAGWEGEPTNECGKVMLGRPCRIKGRTKTFSKTFALVY